MAARGVLMTTVAVPEVSTVAQAWCELAGFEVRAAESDGSLDAPWSLRRGGATTIVTGVPGYDLGLLRFVESTGAAGDPRAVASAGPFGVEFFSRDVDEVVESLAGSPIFRMEGAPREWQMSSLGAADGRSVHVTGPAGLHLFITTRLSVPPPRTLPPIPQLVAAPSNILVAATDAEAVREFYGEALGIGLAVGAELCSEGMNQLVGIHPNAAVFYHLYLTPGGQLSEHNIYPPGIIRGARFDRGLAATGPIGQTFEVDDLESAVTALRRCDLTVWGPHPLAGHPYDGRRVAVAVGPSSERVELVETAA